MSSHRMILNLGVLALLACARPGLAEVSKGHQILIDRGLQLQGQSQDDCYLHLDTFTNANYTSINWLNGADASGQPVHSSRPDWMGDAPGILWARWAADETQMPPQSTPYGGDETPYLDQLMALQMGDEWNINDATMRTRLVDWFNTVRANWPNTILYHNSWGSQIGDAQLYDFYTRAQPDMLCFDTFPWQSVWDVNQPDHTGPPIGGPPTGFYGDLRRYREHARGAGIPLGIYRQTFHAIQDYDQHIFRDPSFSELRLTTSAALAFSAKYFTDFVYNTGAASLFIKIFNGSGDTVINTNNGLYAEMTDVNLRAQNLGKALVRLTPVTTELAAGYTTTMLFIRGKDGAGNYPPVPIGFLTTMSQAYTDWQYQRNDPYLNNNWVVTNQGTNNSGYPGDVILSWFKPLDESFDGPDYTNEIYLMVVNGLSATNGTAADCRQEIKLNFRDAFLAIEMLNPTNGFVEVQPLLLTNGYRQLVLNLNGGDAALFKFSDGAPFVGAQVIGPPVITAQPVSRTNLGGTDATFSVRAAGELPLAYQWRFNSTNLSGAATNTYLRTNVQANHAGSYTVVVTNASGSVTSAVATLTVQAAPQITTQPQSQTVGAGSNVLFTVVATGAPAPTYQWRWNGANILGATASSYLRKNAQSADAGNYSVLVANSVGSVLSSNALLTVNGPPSITAQPLPQAVNVGGTANFSVTAVGTPTLTYRWRNNGAALADGGAISGATTSNLTVTGVQLGDLGSYSVAVSNSYGGTTSVTVTLSIAASPTIQVQPQSRTNLTGTTATFGVVASGGGLNYQWRRSGTNLSESGNASGTTTDLLVLGPVRLPDAASYTVVITNVAGSITSAPATLALVVQQPFREPFDYAPGVNLGGQTNPNSLVWADVGTSTAGPYVTVQSNNLDVAGLATSFGNSIRFGGLGKSARLSFSSPFTSGTLYFSFALKVTDLSGATATGGFIAGFNNSIDTQTGQPTVVGTRVYLRATAGGFNLGVAKNSSTSTDWVWDGTVFPINQTIFLVGSYTFTTVGNATDDISKLWINPNPADFSAADPPAPTLTATAGSDITANSIASFVLFQRDAANEPAAMNADELRIATSWAGVTPCASVVRIDSVTLLPEGRVRLQGSGNPGHFAIEASPDLANWTELASLLSATGTFVYTDPTSYANQRYYRARYSP